MRREICHYFATDVPYVFKAYKQVIKEIFNENCTETPYHTLSFSLGFSFRYNMNGGVCTLHFMPYNNGTAVCIRYTIVQAFGARYGAHDKHMLKLVEKKLNLNGQDINLDIELFLKEENHFIPNSTPVNTPEIIPDNPAFVAFCPKCGIKFAEKDLFCYNCGHKRYQ